ncbi:MAG TPA: TerB family tellurite resistance protein [Chitinophagaceae bacterium]|nr:TerB family tellurite resistance protein [Chitinophagaceae bacterium]
MSTEILSGNSAAEKAAYITAIASIATADNTASENEINYLLNLADHAGLGDADKEGVREAALDKTGSRLKPALDTLKPSELRFSLVADLIAFAESDSNLAPQEKEQIACIADYLGITSDQLGTLHEYVQHASNQSAEGMALSATAGSGGIMDKLKSSGIDMGSLTKGILSFVGPMIIGNLVSKGLNKNSGGASTGGLSNISSLVGSLTGGKGLSGIGGFLSNLLK